MDGATAVSWYGVASIADDGGPDYGIDFGVDYDALKPGAPGAGPDYGYDFGLDYDALRPAPPGPVIKRQFSDADRHVRRSGSDYAIALLQLLPTGQAWPRDPLSTLVLSIQGLAEYWGFVDGRAGDLLEIESDPRATIELLPDWERNWGLPDPCLTNPPTALAERRANLVAKMTLLGAQSRAFFYHVAEEFGYTITITELAPYMTGVSRCGDTRGRFNPGDPGHYYWTLGPPENRFYWTIHVASLKLTYFHCNSSQCGIDRLLAIQMATDLECVFNRWQPAHTKIIYDYSPFERLDFTQPYDTQYLALGIM